MASRASDTPALKSHPATGPRESILAFLQRHGAWLAILAFAFAIRAPTFGNPILGIDEQLYLVVGDRMLHGDLPYVDLWDRKPIGLFLFYAAVRMFGGAGILQYQIAATLCAAGTAGLICAIARRRAGPIASLAVALTYLHMLNDMQGMGGQAGVIYNLITMAAAVAAYRTVDTSDRKRIIRLALASMLAFGVAIQFKYTPVVEGIFFGCFFIWRLWTLGQSLLALAATAAFMIGLALLPTAAALGFYAATGHLAAFVHANFVSIFQRLPFPGILRRYQFFMILIAAGPLLAMSAWAVKRAWRSRSGEQSASLVLLLGWPIASIIGFAMLGDFYSYYFITALPPLLILAATIIRPDRMGFTMACLMIAWPTIMPPPNYWDTARDRAATDTLVAAVRPYVRNHCLYVYSGPTIVYLMTHSCIPTRFVFSDHLTNPVEARALGVDPAQEEARILAGRPGAIITASHPLAGGVNPATQAIMKAALARDYVLVARVPTSARTYFTWALRSLHPAPAPISAPEAATPY